MDMIFGTDRLVRRFLIGNILLVGCFLFYLLWWILAFKPTGSIRGFRSGWLLIPASLLGVTAVLLIVRGAVKVETTHAFFRARTVLLAGVILYAALLLLTRFLLHRRVTTELFLIVGWAVLVFLECNALYALGILTRSAAIVLFAAVAVVAVVSLVCYLLYYGLSGWAGYIDGMIPLLLATACMAVLENCILTMSKNMLQ